MIQELARIQGIPVAIAPFPNPARDAQWLLSKMTMWKPTSQHLRGPHSTRGQSLEIGLGSWLVISPVRLSAHIKHSLQKSLIHDTHHLKKNPVQRTLAFDRYSKFHIQFNVKRDIHHVLYIPFLSKL